MIIDFRVDPDHASQYEVLDATTWQPLPMDGDYARVWYADDQKGILRIILLDEKGMLQLALASDPQTPLSNPCRITAPVTVAWREERRPIRIVRKAEHAS